MHDAKAVSALAHARGAYLFADIIQAVSAVPSRHARGWASTSPQAGTYKWLMGERGLGFLYIRRGWASRGRCCRRQDTGIAGWRTSTARS